jgi:putative transposase
MKQRYAHIGLARLCDVFGKNRQTYYERIAYDDEKRMEAQLVVELIRVKRLDMPRLGGLKLHHLLQDDFKSHNLKIGRDKLFLLLREQGLLIKPKRNYARTTYSYHRFHKYPNLIREVELVRANQIWVSDITYITIRMQFAYLSLITDLYSRKIVGYCLYKTLETKGCIGALTMAVRSVKEPVSSLIHHSDRGIQYCSNAYVKILKTMNIEISMTEKKDAYENSVAERVNGILKSEFALDQCFQSFDRALLEIAKSIQIYNEKRPHLSCNMMTPEQAHNERGKLSRKWKNYYTEKSNLT